MKKIFVLTLIICMIFSLTGCRKHGLDFSTSDSSISLGVETNVEKTDETLKRYFDNNFKNATVAILADVTNDDSSELIVVIERVDGITGYAYTVKENEVVLIETKTGGHDHASGFFAWYIMQGLDSDSYYLVEESFGMWQGMGVVSLESYSFDDSLARKTIETIKLESKEMPVKSQDFDDYVNKIGKIVGKTYNIYSNYTESPQKPLPLDSDKFTILVDKTQTTSSNTSLSEGTDTTSTVDSQQSTGLIRLGKYEGFWAGTSEEGYGYITFKDDGTCHIKTNVDHETGIITTPIDTIGTYTVERREVIYPDDSTGMSTLLTIYIEGSIFASYEGDYDSFTDHWSGYSFVG